MPPDAAGLLTSQPASQPASHTDPVAAIGEHVGRGERPTAIYRHLRDLIVRGHLAPGSALVEMDIARRLGTSRTSVRVALQRLHQQGFIIDAPGPQLFKFVVAPLTREDAQSLFHIMAELEGLAAHYAAALPEEQCQRLAQSLRAVNDKLRAAGGASRPDPESFYELDSTFHRQYVEAGANPRLLAFHEAVRPQVERYWRVYAMLLLDVMDTSAREHDLIVLALARGDANAAQGAARTNWRNSADRLVRAINRMGERGIW